MNKELKEIINMDMDRCFGKGIRPFGYKIINPSVRCQIAYRKASYYFNRNNRILAFITQLRYMRLCQKHQFGISRRTKIGKGLYVGHTGRIIISYQAELGNNVNLSTGITIGISNRGKNKGAPKIGDEVWIGTNAVIVGGG